jgi:hypothetical protein
MGSYLSTSSSLPKKLEEITDSSLFTSRLQEIRRKGEMTKEVMENLISFLCSGPGNNYLLACIPRDYMREAQAYDELFFVREIQKVINSKDAEEYLPTLMYLGSHTLTGKEVIHNVHRSVFVYIEFRNRGLLKYLL